MSDKIIISDLPTDASIGGAETLPIQDGATTKKTSTSAFKDYVLAQLAAVGTVSSMTDNEIFVNTASGIKRITWADFDSVLVNLAGEQTITGDKTFSGAVVVPAPTANGHATTKQYVDTGLGGKVSTVAGKGLSTEDFTTALKTKLEGLPSSVTEPPVTSVNTYTGAVVLAASDVNAAAQTPTFTKADALAEPIGNGETSETLWGKMKKAVGDLIAHLADTAIHVTSSDKTAWNGKQNALTFDDTPTALSNNPVKSQGLKTAIDAKLDAANVKASFSSLTLDTNVPSEKLVKDSLDAKQDAALVTAWQETPDDLHYPSEKLVKDNLTGFQTTANIRTSIRAAASAEDTKYPSEKAAATALEAKQTTSNMVTSWQTTPDNTHYPSEKLVSDELDAIDVAIALKQDTANLVTSVRAVASAEDSKYPSEKAVATALASGGMTVDPTPTGGSTNPVSSGGVYTALSQKQNTLTFDVNPTASSSNPVTSGGVKGALDTKLDANKLVTAWGTPDDTHVPSAKLVKDTIDAGSSAAITLERMTVPSTGEATQTMTMALGADGERAFTLENITGVPSSTTELKFKMTLTVSALTMRKIHIYIKPNSTITSLDFSSFHSSSTTFVTMDGAPVATKKLTVDYNHRYEIDIAVFIPQSGDIYSTVKAFSFQPA